MDASAACNQDEPLELTFLQRPQRGGERAERTHACSSAAARIGGGICAPTTDQDRPLTASQAKSVRAPPATQRETRNTPPHEQVRRRHAITISELIVSDEQTESDAAGQRVSRTNPPITKHERAQSKAAQG